MKTRIATLLEGELILAIDWYGSYMKRRPELRQSFDTIHEGNLQYDGSNLRIYKEMGEDHPLKLNLVQIESHGYDEPAVVELADKTHSVRVLVGIELLSQLEEMNQYDFAELKPGTLFELYNFEILATIHGDDELCLTLEPMDLAISPAKEPSQVEDRQPMYNMPEILDHIDRLRYLRTGVRLRPPILPSKPMAVGSPYAVSGPSGAGDTQQAPNSGFKSQWIEEHASLTDSSVKSNAREEKPLRRSGLVERRTVSKPIGPIDTLPFSQRKCNAPLEIPETVPNSPTETEGKDPSTLTNSSGLLDTQIPLMSQWVEGQTPMRDSVDHSTPQMVSQFVSKPILPTSSSRAHYGPMAGPPEKAAPGRLVQPREPSPTGNRAQHLLGLLKARQDGHNHVDVPPQAEVISADGIRGGNLLRKLQHNALVSDEKASIVNEHEAIVSKDVSSMDIPQTKRPRISSSSPATARRNVPPTHPKHTHLTNKHKEPTQLSPRFDGSPHKVADWLAGPPFHESFFHNSHSNTQVDSQTPTQSGTTRNLAVIPKEQYGILNRMSSWLPPDPVHRFPKSNLPRDIFHCASRKATEATHVSSFDDESMVDSDKGKMAGITKPAMSDEEMDETLPWPPSQSHETTPKQSPKTVAENGEMDEETSEASEDMDEDISWCSSPVVQAESEPNVLPPSSLPLPRTQSVRRLAEDTIASSPPALTMDLVENDEGSEEKSDLEMEIPQGLPVRSSVPPPSSLSSRKQVPTHKSPQIQVVETPLADVTRAQVPASSANKTAKRRADSDENTPSKRTEVVADSFQPCDDELPSSMPVKRLSSAEPKVSPRKVKRLKSEIQFTQGTDIPDQGYRETRRDFFTNIVDKKTTLGHYHSFSSQNMLEDVNDPNLNMLLGHFRNAYGTQIYKAKRRHFLKLCRLIDKIRQSDYAWLPEAEWDNFIIQHNSSYEEYIMRCKRRGEEEMDYEDWYGTLTGTAGHDKAVVTPSWLNRIFGQVDDSAGSAKNSTEPTSIKGNSVPHPSLSFSSPQSQPRNDKEAHHSKTLGQAPIRLSRRRHTTQAPSDPNPKVEVEGMMGTEVAEAAKEGGLSISQNEEATISLGKQAEVEAMEGRLPIDLTTKGQADDGIRMTGLEGLNETEEKPWYMEDDAPFRSFVRDYVKLESLKGVFGEQDASGYVRRRHGGRVDVLGWKWNTGSG